MFEYVSKKIFVAILKVAIYIYESVKAFWNFTFFSILIQYMLKDNKRILLVVNTVFCD